MSVLTSDTGIGATVRQDDLRRDNSPCSVLHALHPRWTRFPVVQQAAGTVFPDQLGRSDVLLIRSGWACRAKVLNDGRRQILALILPGEGCGLHTPVSDPREVVMAISPCSAVMLQRTILNRDMESDPDLRCAVQADVARQTAMTEEHLLTLGCLTALERTAHLICEVCARLRLDGQQILDFPLTQMDLGDLLGLSTVHMNRTLQSLRRAGLIVLRRGKLHVLDLKKLELLGLFSPGYLRLD